MTKQILSFILFSIPFFVSAQSTQTVRGTIADKISQQSLPGASVVVLNSDPFIGSTTDADGNFKLTGVPVGKQTLKITFMGYKEIVMQNLSVNAGKELVLTIGLEEEIAQMDEVTVSAKVEKNKALNDMSMVSTRTFSVEETQKFAAAVNDPARMATSFAGVVQGMDGNNTISIRGNSPNGLLWRMEGVEIPNPNHFSSVGSSGGGISILSAQLLSNSDFSTGAFAAEYGNALSGVFDLKLRRGNNQKREYTFQAGFLGIDASMEGPFKKGYDGSYLINYRYSTLSLISKMGVEIGGATTIFQDVSMNIYLPTKKLGNFSVFGFGGLSSQTSTAYKDSLKWEEDEFYRFNTNFYSNTGAIGLTNTKLFKNQSYLKTALVFSGTQNGYMEDKLNMNYEGIREYEEKYLQNKLTLSSVYTRKINPKNNIRAGVILNQLGYNLLKKDIPDTSTELMEKLKINGSTQTAQGFFQWNHKFNNGFTTNAGLHYMHLLLNNSQSVEPRASIRYELNPKHSVSLGYGLHSQVLPIGVYFARSYTADGTYTSPNKKLQLSKAQHIVAGYDWNINSFTHIKTELYYQHLFNVPVSIDKTSTYSSLNAIDGYGQQILENKGLGKNYGLELTLERYMHRNLYYLLSLSLYDSKYKAPNGNWYDTFFNTNYATSFTMGKEWTLSEKRKKRVIGCNIKSLYVGGLRYTPIDLPASVVAGEAKFKETETFKKKNPDYYRLDIRVSCKRNFNKITTTLALDIQNTSNHKNVGGQYFDDKTGEVKYWYQAGLIPILSYKVEF
jgi:hypothetical protein